MVRGVHDGPHLTKSTSLHRGLHGSVSFSFHLFFCGGGGGGQHFCPEAAMFPIGDVVASPEVRAARSVCWETGRGVES